MITCNRLLIYLKILLSHNSFCSFPGCRGKIITSDVTDEVTETASHTCQARGLNQLELDRNAMIHTMEEMASKDHKKTLRQIFNEVTSQNQAVGQSFGFPTVESRLYKARRSTLPPLPKTRQEACDNLPRYPLYNKILVAVEGESIILGDSRILEFAPRISDILIDGTFYTCPQLW